MAKLNTVQVNHIVRAIELIQRKWTIHILWAMQSGPVRLSGLQRLFPSASKKALRAGLRDLENARVVVRHDMTDVVLHVEYQLVDGVRETLCALLSELSAFDESISGQKQ